MAPGPSDGMAGAVARVVGGACAVFVFPCFLWQRCAWPQDRAAGAGVLESVLLVLAMVAFEVDVVAAADDAPAVAATLLAYSPDRPCEV